MMFWQKITLLDLNYLNIFDSNLRLHHWFSGVNYELVVNLQEIKFFPVLDTFSGCCQQTFGAPR